MDLAKRIISNTKSGQHPTSRFTSAGLIQSTLGVSSLVSIIIGRHILTCSHKADKSRSVIKAVGQADGIPNPANANRPPLAAIRMNPFKRLFRRESKVAESKRFDQNQSETNPESREKAATYNQRWTSFAQGSTIGSFGSEGGKIIEDSECIDGARVTIERGGHIAPYSVTLGIYGLMFHTHFTSTEVEAKKFTDFALKKIEEIFAHYETTQRDKAWHDKHNRLVSELTERKNGG